MSTQHRSRGGRWLAGAAGVSLVASGLAGVGLANAAPAPQVSETTAEDKVRSQVRETLESEGSADVWVMVNAQADLSAAYGMEWEDRGDFVYDSLRATAEESQAELRAELDADGVTYETFWINNAIFVPDASAALVEDLATRGTVKAIKPDSVPQLPDFDAVPTDTAPRAPEWGLTDIGAPDIWSEYDQRGEGIVVGTFDSGVEYTHPALQPSYRGTETGSHDYNWFSSGSTNYPEPTDTNGHGTHVTGTMVGEDGENQVGVAPDAQWIAAAGCCVSGTDSVATFEWFLAPTPIEGGEGDPDMRPHIINNSWGPPGQEDDPYWEEAIGAWEAAGIFAVWAVGNSGPGCDTVLSPSWNVVKAYNVADYQINHEISPTSSRGPDRLGNPGVDIGAPGTDVRSTVPGDDYASFSGTSMASPHVAGAVALLWAEFPDLIGDFDATSALLDESAIDTPDPTCGGEPAHNEVFGEGRLDLVALFEAAGGDDPEPPVTEVVRWFSGEENDDRYTTAAAIAAQFPEGADAVYIASGETYVDALGASPAASQGLLGEGGEGTLPRLASGAPLLLVQGDHVPAVTAAALEALAPADVVVIGGESTVSAEVYDEVGGTLRLSGADESADRYGTAAAISGLFEPGAPVVYVANGAEDEKAADALVGAARAGAEGGPVLLTKGDEVPAVTAAELERLAPEAVVVLGGTDAVDDATLAALGEAAGVEPTRLAGPTRWDTAVAVSEAYEAGGPQVLVANGNNWPDTLAGAAYAGSVGIPVQIVRTDHVPEVVFGELSRLAPEQAVILGGPAAVSEDVAERLGELGAE